MINRKLIFPVAIMLFTSSTAFCQTEVLKGVVNSLAYYNKQKDLKFLANAKKTVDSLIVTKKDSANIEKSVYKAVVYSAIAYTDSTNKLNTPPTFLAQTTQLVNRLTSSNRTYKYGPELDFSKRCLANTYLRNGYTQMHKSDYANALTSFKQAQVYAPHFRQLNGYIAYTNSKLGNLQEAAKYYDLLLDTDTMKTDYVQAAVGTFKSVGDTTKALQILQKGRKALPNDRILLLEEANIYNNRKDYKSLSPLLPSLLDNYPNNAEVAFIAASCYDHLNEYDKAESMYLHTIDLNNASYDPAFNLGLLYLKESTLKADKEGDNLQRAAQWLEKANEISPYETKCLNLLQLVYTKANNTEQLNKVNNKLKQLTN